MATSSILQPFTKVAKTPEDLLAKLKAQGLAVASDAEALAYLRGVGPYRLKGYWHQAIDPQTKRFKAGYEFEDIKQSCELDREVRAATIEAIDRLEVAIRSVMANYLSLKHSPHWFLEPSIFKPTPRKGIGRMIAKIEGEVERSKGKPFVSHYFSKHDDPYLPPSWAISECVTFGLWSQTYAILRYPTDKKAIAKRFNVDQVPVFESWIHALTVLRNVAAHHGQLLLLQLGVAPSNYKKVNLNFRNSKSFFAMATVVNYLLVQTALPQRWKQTLLAIFAAYPRVSPHALGFPTGWETLPGW